MPFIPEFTRLEQFYPDANFDQERDLIRVQFQTQRLFVGLFKDDEWGVSIGDPTLAPSMYENLLKESSRAIDITGMRVDKSVVGGLALFSTLGRTHKKIWKSQEFITGLEPVRRNARSRSTVIVLKNR